MKKKSLSLDREVVLTTEDAGMHPILRAISYFACGWATGHILDSDWGTCNGCTDTCASCNGTCASCNGCSIGCVSANKCQ